VSRSSIRQNSVPPRRITNNAQRPTTGRSGHQADAIVAISSCETFTTNLRPLRIHWVGKAGTTPSVALALTLTSSPTCSSKEIASRAEPQSGRALLMAGAFSTIREQSSQPKRTTWPLRRQSLSFVDRVSWPDAPGTLNSKIVPKGTAPSVHGTAIFQSPRRWDNPGDNPVDRSWLREKRRIYDKEAIANPLEAHAQCFGIWGR
jgi:hypothetical protein